MEGWDEMIIEQTQAEWEEDECASPALMAWMSSAQNRSGVRGQRGQAVTAEVG